MLQEDFSKFFGIFKFYLAKFDTRWSSRTEKSRTEWMKILKILFISAENDHIMVLNVKTYSFLTKITERLSRSFLHSLLSAQNKFVLKNVTDGNKTWEKLKVCTSGRQLIFGTKDKIPIVPTIMKKKLGKKH